MQLRIKKNSIRLAVLFVILVVSINWSGDNRPQPSSEHIISQFIAKVDITKALQMTTIIKERIGKNYSTRKADFKVQASPFKLYMKEEYPVQGREVIFVTGQNNNRAWINPAAFPWTTLSLNPLGNTMRSGSHHSIFKSGYFFINKVLKHLNTKYKSEINTMLKYDGLVNYGKVLCHKITFDNPSFGYTTYKTLPKETLEDISNKLIVDDYMILEKNPQIRNFEDMESGLTLKVPTDYGRTFTLYISKENNLLLGIKVFDEAGLWEEFSYSNIVLNPVFTNLDFSIDNPLYGF